MTEMNHKNGTLVAGGGQQGVYKYDVYADTVVEGYDETFYHLEFFDIRNMEEHNCFSDEKGIGQYLSVVKNVALGRIEREAMPDLLALVGSRKFARAFKKAMAQQQADDEARLTIEAITRALRGESK